MERRIAPTTVLIAGVILLPLRCSLPPSGPPVDQPGMDVLLAPTCDISAYRWAALPGGDIPASAETDAVRALAVFDDGSGPALYVGGQFSVTGGIEAVNIARFDGLAWTPLGFGWGSSRSSGALCSARPVVSGPSSIIY